jgi:transposase-like protein
MPRSRVLQPWRSRLRYSSFGKTADGSPRWVCKACTTVDPVTGKKRVKSFSTPVRALHRQRESHKNHDVFKCLVNKMPLRRICESLEISPDTLYRKVRFPGMALTILRTPGLGSLAKQLGQRFGPQTLPGFGSPHSC